MRRNDRRRKRRIRALGTAVCCLILLAGAAYLIREQVRQQTDARRGAELRALYRTEQRTPEPTPEATPEPTPEPTSTATPEATLTAMPDPTPTAEPTPEKTAAPAPTTASARLQDPTTVPAAVTAQPVPTPPDELPDVVDVPRAAAVDARTPGDGATDVSQGWKLQPAFEALYAQNPDVVGWLSNGGTIDQPVLYRDNDYYLSHNFDGERDAAGAIFLDEHNAIDLSDANVLIYGHNMRSGEMFGDLDSYRKSEALAANPVFTLQSAWEEQPRKYVIFSVFDAAMDEDDPDYIRVMRYNFRTEEAHQAFLDDLRARTLFDCPVDVACEDQLLTLVTCSYSGEDTRLLLYGRALREGESEETIAALYADAFAKANG